MIKDKSKNKRVIKMMKKYLIFHDSRINSKKKQNKL